MAQVYSVSGVKTFRGMEGTGFNANLLENGKKVAFVMDAAQGGEYDWEWIDKESGARFAAFVAALPEEPIEPQMLPFYKGRTTMSVGEDMFVERLINDYEEQRRIKRLVKAKMTFSLTDGKLYTMNRPYSAEGAAKLRQEYGPKLAKIHNEDFLAVRVAVQ